MGGALAFVMIAVLVWGGSGFATPTPASSTGINLAERSRANDDQQPFDANVPFTERARAIEAGFKAAFPFRQ